MRKGNICIVRLADGAGHEQEGTRPAIFYADTKTAIGVVIPLTSNLEALRFPFTVAIAPEKQNGLEKDSVALVFHIRAIDLSRVAKVIGKLSDVDAKKVDALVKKMLKI